jgi:hypothetical protein
MRSILVVPLVVAFALSACGGGTEEAAGGGDAAGGDAVADAAADVAASGFTGPRPGQYRVKTEILEMNVPGMPAGMGVDQMNKMSAAADVTFCVTEQDSAKATREMVTKSGQGNCEVKKLDIADGRVDSEMTCTQNGQTMTSKTSGTINSEGMDLTVEYDMPGMSQKMRVVQTRIGDCAG